MTKTELEAENEELRALLKSVLFLLRTTLAFLVRIGGGDSMQELVTQLDQAMAAVERQSAKYEH